MILAYILGQSIFNFYEDLPMMLEFLVCALAVAVIVLIMNPLTLK